MHWGGLICRRGFPFLGEKGKERGGEKGGEKTRRREGREHHWDVKKISVNKLKFKKMQSTYFQHAMA